MKKYIYSGVLLQHVMFFSSPNDVTRKDENYAYLAYQNNSRFKTDILHKQKTYFKKNEIK